MKKIDLSNPKNVKYKDLFNICVKCFGEPRNKGGHYFFSTPWEGEPYVNLQPLKSDKKMAKPYQVRQVKKALEKVEGYYDE